MQHPAESNLVNLRNFNVYWYQCKIDKIVPSTKTMGTFVIKYGMPQINPNTSNANLYIIMFRVNYKADEYNFESSID